MVACSLCIKYYRNEVILFLKISFMLYMTRRLPRCRDLLPRAVLQVINSVSTKMLLTECLPVLVFIGEVVSAISHTHTHTQDCMGARHQRKRKRDFVVAASD